MWECLIPAVTKIETASTAAPLMQKIKTDGWYVLSMYLCFIAVTLLVLIKIIHILSAVSELQSRPSNHTSMDYSMQHAKCIIV